MSNVKDMILFVKDTIEFFEETNESMPVEHRQDLTDYKNILNFLEDSLPRNSSLFIHPDDLAGLPEELIQELNLNASEFKDFQLIDVIQSLGGVAGIDKILIGFYKATKEIESRTKLTSRLYRMSTRGLVFPHPTRKGIYASSQAALDTLMNVEQEEEGL